MNERWPPTFDVIYIPGAVHVLFDFARSLAEHSPFRFRLISNACTDAEEKLLSDAAARHPQFEFASLESKSVLTHGEALQRLFRSESADTFACIDSDIFARGPFLAEAESRLAENAAVFSGLSAWMPFEERVMPGHFVYMGGRFAQMDDGRCLGVSYCALYQRAAVEQVMDRTGVTFHSRQWWDLPAERQALLSKMGFAKRKYDTTKLVNLMLADAGFSLAMCPEPNLLHLGGLANLSVRRFRLARRLVARMRQLVQSNRPGPMPRRGAFETRLRNSSMQRRRIVEDYFRHLLGGGAVDGGPLPQFPANGRQQLLEMGREFLVLRQRYAGG